MGRVVTNSTNYKINNPGIDTIRMNSTAEERTADLCIWNVEVHTVALDAILQVLCVLHGISNTHSKTRQDSSRAPAYIHDLFLPNYL